MSHPISCWDIHAEGLDRRMHFAADLKLLQKIMNEKNWHNLPVSPGNSLIWENKVIIITDSNLTIIHATENIFAMNGYKQEEVIGKTPKIFQGKKTENVARKLIRTAINNLKPFEALITNYKKDGSSYKCHIEGYPVFNKKGSLVNFIALEDAG